MKDLKIWEIDRPEIIKIPNGELCFKGKLRLSPHGDALHYSYYHKKRILFVEHAADYFTSRDVRDVYFAERLGGFRFRLRPIKHVLNMEIRMVGAFGEVGSK